MTNIQQAAEAASVEIAKAYGESQSSPLIAGIIARHFAAYAELVEAAEIVLVQFGPYVDGQGAAKFHAVNIAQEALRKVKGL